MFLIRRSKLYDTASDIITPADGRPLHKCTCARDGSLNSNLGIRRRRAVGFKPEYFGSDIVHLIRVFGTVT